MSSMDPYRTWANLTELWWNRHGMPSPFDGRAQRLDALVRHARRHSPFYRDLYAGLPQDLPLEGLPRVSRAQLMARFDDWVTDRRIRLRDVETFLTDRTRIGEPFLGHYRIWKSSGTSGIPGIFVQDEHALGVYDALVASQIEDIPWSAGSAARALAANGRAALVVANGDHFASIASWERMRRTLPFVDARSFSALAPLADLAAELEAFAPAILSGYPSMLSLLADEHAAGRLAIAPSMIWSGGEHLAPAARRAIERAFDCPVMNEYGASECMSIAHECREGWMHLHHEWVALEGVDDDGLPTAPGKLSRTCLLTNLANWIQPVIRYDLGDRITAAKVPCRCGDPRPAFRVEGRVEATLVMRSAKGRRVRLTPLAISTVVEEKAEGHRFQIAQIGPERLALRLEGSNAQMSGVRRRAVDALRAWLRLQSLPNVAVVQERSQPRLDPSSGKLHDVVIEDRGAV
jgi:phenylacetate-coenzyme A ligase PaaK-like adenylate-forming protein